MLNGDRIIILKKFHVTSISNIRSWADTNRKDPKRSIFLYASATCSEILSSISTMVTPSCVLGFGKLHMVGAGKKLTAKSLLEISLKILPNHELFKFKNALKLLSRH